MAGLSNTSTARGASSPRQRFEHRYQTALVEHLRAPTEHGLAEAQTLGREALSEGISVLDVVSIHLDAQRGLFPGLGPQFAAIGVFLRESLTAFQRLPDELHEAQELADAEGRRGDALLERSAQQTAARHAAEEVSDRLRTMRDVAIELSRATTRRAVAAATLRAAMGISGGDVGTVALFGRRTRGRAQRPDLLATIPPRDARRVRALNAAAHAIDGLLEPHASLELTSLDEIRKAIGDGPTAVLGVRSLTVHPIVWGGKVRGALVIGATFDDGFDHVDGELVDAVVVMGGSALERAGRFDIDHEIALKLQRGMLSIPPCDAAETPWSAHYSSAATGLVGGDWYDVIDLGERIGFAIGDIVGRGINAATAMGQVRSAGRALANCFDKPHEVVEGLDHFASATGSGEDSSMAYLTINRRSGEVAYAVAGHPPPLVLLPGGAEIWLDAASSSLLGRGGSRPSASLFVDPGTTVVLYTDGLVERRGEQLDEGLARLGAAARGLSGTDDAARVLVEGIGAEHGIDDDVAVLVVTFVGG